MAKILIVEDEAALGRTLAITLRAKGYEVALSGSGERGLEVFARSEPDLIVLDLGLPGMDGLDFLRSVRDRSEVPILVLSGRSDVAEKVDALDAGANDYVTKPFSIEELLARLRVLRRVVPPAPEPDDVRFGTVVIDFVAHRVTAAGEDVHLTPTEWHLLEVLTREPGRLLSRKQLLLEVWGPGYETAAGSLRLYMAQLRKKLEVDPGRPQHLLNEPGLGYRFEP